MITQGDAAHPLNVNDHFFGPIIKEVHWGAGIGLLIIELPDSVTLTFNPAAAYLWGKTPGDVIEKSDLLGSLTYLPISESTSIVRSLYGEGEKLWQAGIILNSPGADPGPHFGPDPFGGPGAPFIFLNNNAHDDWVGYTAVYATIKAQYEHVLRRRWIEIDDLKSISDDTFSIL